MKKSEEKEIEMKRDAALFRALTTPHKPQKRAKAAKKAKKPAK